MVIDTSAIMAVLKLEPEAAAFAESIEQAARRLVSAGTVLEAGIVAESRPQGGRELDGFLAAARFEIVAFDAEQAEIAREAFRRFGKGRHPAGLNFGDCIAYALSQHAGEPLLYKGDDFSKTDVVRAS
jgi:ribonuclease VapC